MDQKKYKELVAWVETIRPHWELKPNGIYNDPEFWNECLHNAPDSIWTNWLELLPDLYKAEYDRRFPTMLEDTAEIQERLANNQRITIPYNKKGYNRPVFRLAMVIKDIITERNGTKFAQKSKQSKQSLKQQKQQQALEQLDALRTTLSELFDFE